MRLSKIQIAGFKSFVDPTTIDLRSNLTGIVGPNGCGKSNTIDAVRWVMGESSAKHLRGASMDDVIFNGSSSRKPIGQASIELLFDNSDASLGGEYAEFSEIGIKRLISRDGQSKYFLNGTRCRRRDITDIFLGTGLGPRSYAIIEQGMISRLIEAKPEELRNTLEEAAGISKYKDRRRETERRIKNTRENLDRLTDLREELEKQLSHLNRQAKAAEKFKTFKQDERRVSAELILLRLNKVKQDILNRQETINEKATTHQAQLSEQRSLENQIEAKRSEHTEANENFNTVQANFYQIGAEISRLEQSIQHQKELSERHQRDLNQVDSEINAANIHAEEDRRQFERANQELEILEPLLEKKQELFTASTEALNEAEAKLREWQSSWSSLQQKLAEPAQQAQVERARMEQLENQLQQIASRLIKLNTDKAIFNTDSHKEELLKQQELLAETKQKSKQVQEEFNRCKEALSAQIENNKTLQNQLQESRSELQGLSGKLSSLEVLQRAGLGKDSNNKAPKKLKSWLTENGLDDVSALAESIEIESGWEKALETILGDLLQSKPLESQEKLTQLMANAPDVSASFIIKNDKDTPPLTGSFSGSLAAKVAKPNYLHALLINVKCAESLEEAISKQHSLKPGEVYITKEGIVLGANWLKKQANDSGNKHEGVLERQKQIDETLALIENTKQQLNTHEESLENGQQHRKALEEQQSELQTRLNELHREESQAQSVIYASENRIKQTESNQQRVLAEVEELEIQQMTNQESHQSATHLRNQALALLETLESEKVDIEGKDAPLIEEVNRLKEQTRLLGSETQQTQIKVESFKTTQSSAQQQLNRLDERLSLLQERKIQLVEQNNTTEVDSVENSAQQLEIQLEKRKNVETELAKSRDALQLIDNTVRELEQKRHQAEQEVERYRTTLESLKMEWQEVSVREQTLQEQFDETEFDLETLSEQMDENITLDSHKNLLESIQTKVSRLGAINLAAIEEFKTQSERKIYLDKQDADLMEALETLETAIAKIDKDTRSRFKETFEKVNSRIQDMFPQLFGGGKAHLEMTGDDLLTTGIAIMAQPPGKRISSIHLMSGGEKALTAVAMVFAIFELNPAPFCMLDEVDAPLDEANVGRFCQLVKKMSDRVQFIFITHNKTTMELAENLVGVTMREPGISRLVSVDVNEASRMVEE
ncbi:chromosome segregation protein SMC [Cocleimonas sp. KMM 6892]|uniref:chromosome segregation protein SMC n=1 Tax=unclassified Cocleimonas TaxID=2639732 RepID=UPI002DBA6190|nr:MULTISPECIES: chromosome segregation protein SMC [unclassified Cocleimonas]MEB8432125.1 chromosome segregation protein SMC [Cocleimonas sp. KMM 6892]MEC4714789.1 chromosome segregation protein SMC [Cocleimonas sp. KMM 6895]MEC4744397.1 chromosome segregation protein SMC [Cocleimonas sp. KMM 6896]